MYEDHREGEITGPTVEARRADLAEQLNTMYTGLGEVLTNQENKIGSIEQARMIYIGMDGKVNSTKSTFGHGTEVSMYEPIQEASKAGLPIIGIHTHPEDANFSFADYGLMLTGDKREGMRLMKAGMVLLPHMQLLAIASEDTPIFNTTEEAYQFAKSKEVELNSQQMQLARDSLGKLKDISERRKLVESVKMIKKTLGEKYVTIVDEVAGQYNIQENESEQLSQKMEEETTKASNESAKMSNTGLVGFAREIGVKLYFSEDMRTFKEFSA